MNLRGHPHPGGFQDIAHPPLSVLIQSDMSCQKDRQMVHPVLQESGKFLFPAPTFRNRPGCSHAGQS